MMTNATIIILTAALIIQAFGLLSFATSVAFLCISLCIATVVFIKLKTKLQEQHDEIEASQTKHRHFGILYRSYTDEHNDLWMNYADIQQQIPSVKKPFILSRIYPNHFRKANPKSDAWHAHHKILRKLFDKKLNENLNSIVIFLENKVIAPHIAEVQLTKNIKKQPKKMSQKKSFVSRYWNGDLSPFLILSIAGIALAISHYIFQLLTPDDFVANYQTSAILRLAQIVTTSIILFCCGHSLFLSAQRWMFSSRSVFVALLSICGGLYLFIYSLQPFTSKYEQYSFAEWLIIATDSDEKADILYRPKSHALTIKGALGFGTTNKLREALAKHPDVKLIGLNSPGGRTAEGDAIYHLVKENRMDTLVWDQCASACIAIYIAGKNRYLTDTAEFGLHRSGHHWDERDSGPSATDLYFAALQRKAGVAEWLIQRGLEPSIHGIYRPTPQEALDGHLATAWWGTKMPNL
jgi:hypothetical protein